MSKARQIKNDDLNNCILTAIKKGIINSSLKYKGCQRQKEMINNTPKQILHLASNL